MEFTIYFPRIKMITGKVLEKWVRNGDRGVDIVNDEREPFIVIGKVIQMPDDNWHETYTVNDAISKMPSLDGTASEKLHDLLMAGHGDVKLNLVMICMTPLERQSILAAKIIG